MMEIGIIGLGKMGFNLALNAVSRGHRVVGYNRSLEKVKKAAEKGIEGAYTVQELVEKLSPPRTVWLMIPAGPPVDRSINELLVLLDKEDIIIDGGNSKYTDTLRRAKRIKQEGLHFVDVGTSGGTEGARYGICAMIGAEEETFRVLENFFKDISVEKGYLHTGRPGSGHFVKMVHNGVEYGMLQAMGEGFEIMEASEFDLNLKEVSRVWNHGSVIRGWLMELMQSAFNKDVKLANIKGVVHSSGEGLWTAQTALDLGVPAVIITNSVFIRYRSEQEDTFAGKVVAALRNEFGGHEVEFLKEVGLDAD